MAAALAICVIGGGTYYYMHTNTTQTKTQYTTGKVEKGTVKTLISATGTINPVNYVDVSTNVAGKLESVLVKENDQVTEGQVIARQTYDTAVSTYEQAKATYDSAVANLSDATITAPMTGTIIGTPLKAGQTISTGISTQMVIATIADLSNLEIYLTVDETDIGNIRSGSKVDFTVDSQPGKTFTGYVSQIAKGTKGEMGTTSSSVVYYTVKVQIPSDIADKFLPTMTARATIYGDEQKDTLVVPMTAVRTDKQGEYVYVIKNGQPTRTSVSTGLTGDTNIQILNGVSEGDEIVVSGDVTTSNKSSGRMGLF